MLTLSHPLWHTSSRSAHCLHFQVFHK
jgi:hypothetical protein